MAKTTKKIKIGALYVGGGERVKIQSMTTVKTSDVENCVAQILALERAGCDIIRVAVLDEADALAIKAVKDEIHIPLVADIHFSPKLAVRAIENGADKIRVNPGNIGGESQLKRVADAVNLHHIPVRVGSNTGSIEPTFLQKYGRSARALVESALYNVELLEKYGVYNQGISVKASSVPLTVEAYREISKRTDYPLHIGVTEAGTKAGGIVKSSVGIGSLLLDGIGDTVRVSLTDDPVEEIYVAKNILRACGLEDDYVELVSCPTCGRCQWDSMELAQKVEKYVQNIPVKAKIAVMGCVVNGPGEAKDADLGIAGGNGFCMLFQKGEPYLRVESNESEGVFLRELDRVLKEKMER